MTVDMSRLDVPLPTLREQIADLVARQNEATDRAADRLRTLLAPTDTDPTTPEEGPK